MRLWMRQEADPDARRAPIVPADAGRLVAAGALVTVERSAHRVCPAEEYAAAGCALAAADGWASAPAEPTEHEIANAAATATTTLFDPFRVNP